MRNKLAVGGLAVVVGFLVATNPVVADAAGQVTSGMIKNGTIKGKDVKDNSLKGKDVKDNSLGGADIDESSLTGVKADKLDGLDANQLARATTASLANLADEIDGFDAAAFTDIVSKQVTAPTAGIFVISGQVNFNRDFDDADPAMLALRGAVNGVAATVESNARATEILTAGHAGHVSGAFAVPAGTHTVSLQAQEVSAGLAYITERSITVVFVPFGNAGTSVLGAQDLTGPASNSNQ